MTNKLTIQKFVSTLFMQNAYLLQYPGRDDCIVVDPGFDSEQIQDYLPRHNLTLKAILNTHGHVDHIAGNGLLKQCWPDCPIVIGAGDADKLHDANQNLSAQYGAAIVSPPADQEVDERSPFEAAGIRLEVLETPGHTRGHVVYIWKQGTPWIALVGDVLFQGGVGRTDFPDSDTAALMSSIRGKLFSLPNDTIVLSGHGSSTTIGAEKQSNPYVGQSDPGPA